MTWSLGRKGLGPWATRTGLLAIAVLTLATGGSVAAAPIRALDASGQIVKVSEPDRLFQDAAMNDLRTLRSELTFEPFLPSDLALPAGDLYNRSPGVLRRSLDSGFSSVLHRVQREVAHSTWMSQ